MRKTSATVAVPSSADSAAGKKIDAVEKKQQVLNERPVLKAVGVEITTAEADCMVHHFTFIAMLYVGKSERDAPEPDTQGQKKDHQQRPVFSEYVKQAF
jgi:hypothetical protein